MLEHKILEKNVKEQISLGSLRIENIYITMQVFILIYIYLKL